jgi:2-polyprenyl-3-methyl-5-hydroxy-6-metoxy-1,4-benzoquinol methylase/predicted RNA-binding Zn-ribbon protein involved in translation (DUF1610 family)
MYVPLKETEIRPDHLLKQHDVLFEADIRRLLRRRAEFVEVPCPACGAEARRAGWRKYELEYPICAQCGTMYMSPRPTSAILDDYCATSESYQYWNNYIFPASEQARRSKIFRPRAERITAIMRSHGVQPGTLLEVGAGFGTFCEEVRQLGVFRRVIAVEPAPDLARTCRQKGLDLIDKPIEQVDLSREPVDVVVSFEVIEHLFAPRRVLESCFAVLAPGGLLVVTCPNRLGFEVMTLREVSKTISVEHLNYFHPASLSRLVTSCGFEVLEVFTPGQLDAELVRKEILKGSFDVSGQEFLQHILVDQWEALGARFQQFLAENALSSHMWLVARKPRAKTKPA